jgi:hypothetical protein
MSIIYIKSKPSFYIVIDQNSNTVNLFKSLPKEIKDLRLTTYRWEPKTEMIDSFIYGAYTSKPILLDIGEIVGYLILKFNMNQTTGIIMYQRHTQKSKVELLVGAPYNGLTKQLREIGVDAMEINLEEKSRVHMFPTPKKWFER